MRADLMWAAGFYEGEGSITACDGKLFLSVAQVDREPLDRFAAAVQCGRITWGGRIHRWRAHGLAAQRAAMTLWPELSRRRQDQVLRALLTFTQRRVRPPASCRRGHLYAVDGVYVDPRGRRECRTCRDDRRSGGLVPQALPTALEARVGVREFLRVPPTMRTTREALAWTFDVAPGEYVRLEAQT